jgi:hypothetical protein
MKHLVLIACAMLLASCGGDVTDRAKETLNKGGEVVGETATEVLEGIKEGMDKTLECELVITEDLKKKGVSNGKFEVVSDSTGGNNNVLTAYLIFNQDFSDTLHAKAFDKSRVEIGRAKVPVTAKAGEAGYYDFKFDPRTYIEVKSRIEISQ